MRTLGLWLALGFLVGCTSSPSEVATEASTTDSPPTSGSPTTTPEDTTAADSGHGTSASTGEEVCPPMPPEDGGYDPCPGLCGGGGQCFEDGAEYAVCTRGCFMDCNCWSAPAGDGDARVSCSSALLENTSVCVLDCSGGESCPRGMFCVSDLGICAHPYPGSQAESSSSSDGTTEMGSTSGTTDMGSTSSGGTTDMGTTDMGSTSSGGTTDMGSTDPGTTSGSTSAGTGST